ncbi:MAG: hypothetical protein ACR2M5_16235 [Nakamurella sp.]
MTLSVLVVVGPVLMTRIVVVVGVVSVGGLAHGMAPIRLEGG